MKKPKEDIAVMLPDGFYRPFLRYKILEQINRLPDKFPWDIKMVSASNIEEWIAFNSARRLQSLAEKIVLITYAFPNRDTITTYIKEAIDAISEYDFEREAFNAYVVNDGEYIGSTTSGPHLSRMPTTIKSIKDKLVGKTLERIAECIANIIAKKISEFMLEKLKRTLKINIEELRDLVSTKTFQNILVVHIEKIVVTSFLVVSAGIVGITLVEAGLLTAVGLATGAAVFAVATAATVVGYTVFFPVDVNSEKWRKKVAEETFHEFKKKREEVKQKVCEKATGEIHKKFRESEKALMKSYNEICDVGKNLQMANRVHTVETFSSKFGSINEAWFISLVYRRSLKICIIKQGGRQQEKRCSGKIRQTNTSTNY
ncbi:hypothetical protein FSP39_011621 [Pinctada imbricata]|uniref:Uncharacterized protein n=1 Tax=Pinctada imbricata TaxID=66713 RepID=A0AA89C6P4_PINIB|nr:hypothetical protein FSP39_011621 [Pinctada imbricata]